MMLYRFKDCELDIPRQELRRSGAAVHVEPQVFDLLVFLLSNRERIVSKDAILDAVWDGRIVSEATLSSRINAARRALGDNGNDQALIRTAHKRGFRFVGKIQKSDASETDVEAPRLVPDTPVASDRVPGNISISAEVSRLGDVISEAVKAEAITRSS